MKGLFEQIKRHIAKVIKLLIYIIKNDMIKYLMICLVFVALCATSLYSQTYSVNGPVIDPYKPSDKHFSGRWQATRGNKTYLFVFKEQQIDFGSDKIYGITGSLDIIENGVTLVSRKRNGAKSFLIGIQGNKEGNELACLINSKEDLIHDKATMQLNDDYSQALWINIKFMERRTNYRKSEIPDSLVFQRLK